MIELYSKVIIKKSGIPGAVVSVDSNGGTETPIYFVEIDDKYKDGENDLVWCEQDEIEAVG